MRKLTFGMNHAGLIDDEQSPGTDSRGQFGIGLGVEVDELGERLARYAGGVAECGRGGCRRGEAEPWDAWRCRSHP